MKVVSWRSLWRRLSSCCCPKPPPSPSIYLSTYILYLSTYILYLSIYLHVISIYLSIYEGGVLAFFMETSEFMLLSQTSSLTLAISSILKEVNSTIGVFSFFTIFYIYHFYFIPTFYKFFNLPINYQIYQSISLLIYLSICLSVFLYISKKNFGLIHVQYFIYLS